MLAGLVQQRIRLHLRVSLVPGPVKRRGLASFARANLPEHHIGHSQLLELLLTVRLLVRLVDHDRWPEGPYFAVVHPEHLFVFLVLLEEQHAQRLDALLVHHVDGRIGDESAATIRLKLAVKIV